jgi:hypothetical protein
VRTLAAIAAVVALCAGCTTTTGDKPQPEPAPVTTSPAAPSPSLATPAAPVLVPEFGGRGDQPVPTFTAARYTIVITCTGGGPVAVVDGKKPIGGHVGRCDGSGNSITNALPATAPVHLRITAGSSATWTARVESR